MKKPHVICHMMSSINGKIISENWGAKEARKRFSGMYEKCHESFKSEAWMIGRVTLEVNFTAGKKPVLSKLEGLILREPFLADESATSFAIAVDAKGKLRWESNELGGEHNSI